MLKKFLASLEKEKGYVLLFLIVLIVYVCFLVFYKLSPESKESKKPSPAVAEFHKAEEKWQQKLKVDSKSVEESLKQRPLVSFLFGLFSSFIILAFSVGIAFDFLLVFKPAWRANLSRRGPPETTPWSIGMLVKVIILLLVVSVILALLLNLLHRFLLPQSSLNFYALFHTTLLDILCFVVICYVIGQYHGNWRDLGFQTGGLNIFREMGFGIAGYAAILPLFLIPLVLLVLIANFFKYEPPPHPLVEVFLEEEKRSPWIVVYSIILASFVGPIFEEIFFRGFCYSIFKNRWGRLWGAVISAGLFSLIHQNEFAFLPIFILGLGLAFLYEKRRNLFAPIALHILHNTIFMGYFFLIKDVILKGSAQ